MAAIDRAPLEFAAAGHSVEVFWAVFAQHVADWTAARGVELRDAIVLLPFAQLLAPARAALARHGAWLPRVETTQTLARSLGPSNRAEPMQLSLDASTDLLAAQRLLAGQAWAREAWAHDPRGLAHAVGALVDTAQALWRAAAAVPPGQRAESWARARDLLAPVSGPGSVERRLARVALEWAALGIVPATDRLFELRPGAWVVLQAGGPDPLAAALQATAPAGTPSLHLDADPPAARLWPSGRELAPPALAVCDGFEHEAQCAAAQVVAHLQRGEQPVALIAQDRVLVRRIRALLERSNATLLDETGWTLSTTRAAGRIMALQRAAAEDAGSDALFEWLKSIDAWPGWRDTPTRVAALEAACRKAQLARVEQLESLPLEEPLATSRSQVLALLRRYRQAGPGEPGAWLGRLGEALAACGGHATLQADEAGRQALAALRLDVPPATWPAGLQPGGADPLDAAGFSAWVDAVFEHAIYRPGARGGAAPQVVVTPLAQALLRPFAAIVLPGADDAQFGVPPAPHPLLGETLLRELGLPDAEQRRSAEATALAHAVQAAPLTLLRRRLDQREPRGDSPLVERLRLELQRAGSDLAAWSDPRPGLSPPATPQTLPAPGAAALLPQKISASAAEALRACPYRWFALYLLGLDEAQELGTEVEKRDYGNWLHDVLQRFHAERGAPAERGVERARLAAIGRAVQADHRIDDDEFLAYAASFDVFVPRYVDWLHERDAAGTAWRESETEREIALPGVPGITLRGRMDRIDSTAGRSGAGLELIDYKTGGTQGLKDRVKLPFEDTQLAVYAALVADEGLPTKAIYLAVDSTRELAEIEHKNVERSAAALVRGLADDLRRLQAGAGLPALGEGQTCDYCAARGLCRRDHWTQEAAT
jgi:ATP-dependent helicase/nuclease subunit B